MMMATYPVAGVKNTHPWFDFVTNFRCICATGVEAASGRRMDQAGDFTRQSGQFAALLRVGHRQGIPQNLGVRMSRVTRTAPVHAVLPYPSGIHDGNAMANLLHDAQIVADKQVGQVQSSLQVGHQVDDLGLDGNIQCTGGFVENDEFGFGGQGSGDADPLLLPAAEFVRVSEKMFRPQVHRVEQLGRAFQASAMIETRADEKRLA